jgi:hypothetical protein
MASLSSAATRETLRTRPRNQLRPIVKLSGDMSGRAVLEDFGNALGQRLRLAVGHQRKVSSS